MTVLGIICLLIAFGWGWYNYTYLKSEGISQKKALFFSMSRAISLFVASMWFLKIEDGFLNGADVAHNINEVNIANSVDLPSGGGFVNAVPWIIGAIGIGIIAPEILPFLFSAM